MLYLFGIIFLFSLENYGFVVPATCLKSFYSLLVIENSTTKVISLKFYQMVTVLQF